MATRRIHKTYRFRLYPKPAQEAYFRFVCACCRVVYNAVLQSWVDALAARRRDRRRALPELADMMRILESLEHTEIGPDGRPYLSRVDRTALTNEIAQLASVLAVFRQKISNGEKSSEAGFPQFKEKCPRGSFTVDFKRKNAIQPNKVRLAKVGWVNAKCWREVAGRPQRCTVSVDDAGRWWIAIYCADVPAPEEPEAAGTAVVRMGAGGDVDILLRDCVSPVCQIGDKECNIAKPLESETAVEDSGGPDSSEAIARRVAMRRERREQRRLARREGASGGPKSHRWEEQARKVALMRASDRDRVRTQACQLAAALVRDNKTVVVEGRPCSPLERALVARLRELCNQPGSARKLVLR